MNADRNSRFVYVGGGLIAAVLLVFSMYRMARPTQHAPDAAPQAAPTTTLPPMESARTNAGPEAVEPQAADVAGVARISQEDLLAKFRAGQVTIIDVRDKDAYLERHIPGALHIPLAYIPGEIPYLPKDKPIVTYCT